MNPIKYLRIVMAVMLATMGPNVFAIDTAIATLELSGNVPTVFSLTARGLPGDLDLTPNVEVQNRLIGILHFKYNQDVDTITFESSTGSGMPENAAGDAYDFGTDFSVSITPDCFSIDEADITDVVLSAPVEAASDEARDLANNGGNGVIEDCHLTASWGGTTASLPLAGVYSMTITVTMVSQ